LASLCAAKYTEEKASQGKIHPKILNQVQGVVMNSIITIIGTVHHATKNYTVDDLYNKLCDIKPDIILFEWPLEWEKNLEAQMNYAAKTGTLESIAVQQYSKEQKFEIKLYDIPGRNDFYIKTRCFEIEKERSEVYCDCFKSKNPNPSAVAYRNILNKIGKIQDKWDKGTLEEVNSVTCDTVTKTYMEAMYSLYLAILEFVPELKKYKSAYLIQERYEVKRNKTMVKNILNYNKQYENKHLVVLCGYYHRHALISMLKSKQKSDTFTLNF
jgi:pheromone shutdown protein TraB